MKKLLFIAVVLMMTVSLCAVRLAPTGVSEAGEDGCAVPASAATDGAVAAKAAYLTDSTCSVEMSAYKATDRLPIASMVKIMTALLVFEQIESGGLALNDDVEVGENASAMGGSQIFLEANTVHKAENLLKSIIICSANDSCVALAEHIAGSEEGFVRRMNERAAELGMTNTRFASCTGLPMPEQYSCARDVAVMFSTLCTHPGYFEFSGIWMEDYVHPDGRITQMANTNKLLRAMRGCDGGKTGFTNEAMFCVAATAERDNMRLISVVIGANDGKTRFATAAKLINEGFADYENKTVLTPGEAVGEISVKRGKYKTVSVTPAAEYKTVVKRGEKSDVSTNLELNDEIKAPAEAGTVVGKAVVLRNGVVIGEVPLVLREKAERGGLFDWFRNRFKD